MKVASFIRQRSFARYVMIDLAKAAEQIGWQARWIDLEGLLFQHANEPAERRRAVIGQTLLDLEAFDPDLILSYGVEYLGRPFDGFVDGLHHRLVEIVQRPAVYFFFDFGYPFDRPIDTETIEYVAPLQSERALVYSWDRASLDVLHRYGVRRARYFPMAVNDRMFFRDEAALARDPARIPILFVGGPTDERIAGLAPLCDLGLQVYGYDRHVWEADERLRRCYAGEIAERDRLRDAYSRARISVNVTRAHGATSLNMRVYESMACGSLLLTDDRSDARTLFTPGEEIVVYTSTNELRELAQYYLAHEDERRCIAENGRARVLREHTYEQRLQTEAPVIEQFRKEAALFQRLQEFRQQDPHKALRFVQYLGGDGLVSINVDNLRYWEGRTHADLGDRLRAAECADAALAMNAEHLLARELKSSCR